MSGEFDAAINKLNDDIAAKEVELRELKRTVNRLCGYAGRPDQYADADEATTSRSVASIRPDQFYGQPLASAIREYLEMRRASGLGAAKVRDIFDALKQGGFKFETKDDTNAERGLRQSLTKNSVTFHKLPSNTYGLLEWYPNAKPARASDAKSADGQQPSAEKSTQDDASTDDQDDEASVFK
jgi:hypothetical protein